MGQHVVKIAPLVGELLGQLVERDGDRASEFRQARAFRRKQFVETRVASVRRDQFLQFLNFTS